MKTDKSEMSEAKRALLEKYFRGEVKQAAYNANGITTSDVVEVTKVRERVVPVQVGGSKRPFFYLHGDWTGRAFYCYPLAHQLGSDQPFYILEPYNFDDLPNPPTFEDMAASHIKSMQTIQPTGPYLLGGWCNGGLIAYEIAQQLLTKGQKVDLLLLLDADYPAYAYPASMRLVRNAISRFGDLLRIRKEKQVNLFLLYRHLRQLFHFWRVKDTEKLQYVKHVGLWHIRENALFRFPYLNALFPAPQALRQDWPGVYEWISLGYKPGLYPDKITFFWDDTDGWRRVGWRKVEEAKANEIEVSILSGSHYSLRTDDVHVLAEHLHASLSKVM